MHSFSLPSFFDFGNKFLDFWFLFQTLNYKSSFVIQASAACIFLFFYFLFGKGITGINIWFYNFIFLFFYNLVFHFPFLFYPRGVTWEELQEALVLSRDDQNSFITITFSKEVEKERNENKFSMKVSTSLTPGLDNTRLFMSLTAGAGTRCDPLLY